MKVDGLPRFENGGPTVQMHLLLWAIRIEVLYAPESTFGSSRYYQAYEVRYVELFYVLGYSKNRVQKSQLLRLRNAAY